MRKYNILLFAWIIGVSACEMNIPEEPIANEPPEINEVRALLQGKLLTPKGELKSIDGFQPDESGFHFRSDYYYDEDGNLILSLGIYIKGSLGSPIYTVGDTTGVTVYVYSDGKLAERKSFDYKEGNFIYRSSRFNTYDEKGRLFQFLNSNGDPIVTHYYNEKGLLEFKRYGEDQAGDFDEFEYDEEDRPKNPKKEEGKMKKRSCRRNGVQLPGPAIKKGGRIKSVSSTTERHRTVRLVSGPNEGHEKGPTPI
jgi:hypothetical protein